MSREQLRQHIVSAARPEVDRSVLFVDGPLGIGKSFLVRRAVAMMREEADGSTVAPSLLWVSAHAADRGDEDPFATLNQQGAPPSIVIVDDVQWADPDLLDRLEALIVGPLSQPLSVVLLHRPTQVPLRLLAAARRSGARLNRVVVPPMGEDEVASVVADLAPDGRAQVVAHADGNPLFATLLAQLWRTDPDPERYRASLKGVRLAALPVAYGALRTDIARLGEVERQVLRAVALTGIYRIVTVERLTGLSLDAIAEARVELVKKQLFTTRDDGEVVIAHPVLRAAAYRGTDASERSRLHRLLHDDPLLATADARAENLAMLGDELTPYEVSLICDAAQARITEDAWDVVRWTAETLHVPDARRDLLRLRALIALGEWEAAERWAQTAPAENAPLLRAERIRARRLAGHGVDARGGLRGSLPLPHLAERMQYAAGHVAEDHWEAAAEALSASEGEPAARAAALALEALTACENGDHSRAVARLSEAVPALSSLDRNTLTAMLPATVWTVGAAIQLADWNGVSSVGLAGIDAALTVGDLSTAACLSACVAHAVGAQGDVRAGLERLAGGSQWAQQCKDPDALALTSTVAGILADAAGDTERLDGPLVEVAAPPERAPSRWVERWTRPVLNVRAARQGETGLDASIWPLGVNLPVRFGCSAEVLALAGDAKGASRMVAAAHSAAATSGVHFHVAVAHEAEGRVHVARGETQAGIAALVRAVEGYEQQAAFGWAMAARRCAQASEERERLDALSVLTSREREVAAHVARGLANKEIAAILGISARTVEEHVSRVRAKLGLASRAAVGSALARVTPGAASSDGGAHLP